MTAWVVTIEEEFRSLEQEKLQTRWMYRVARSEQNTNTDAQHVYWPSKVSVGPWYALKAGDVVHSWHPRLKAEEVKKHSLVHFLKRSHKPKERYYEALSEVVDVLRDSYNGLHPKWRDDTQSFLEMMLLDGCFLLEFIYTLREIKSGSSNDSANPEIMRVLENQEEMKCYVHDILLLDNQVPLMLLETLHSVYTGDDRNEFLKVVAATFIPTNSVAKIESMLGKLESSLHILDLYRRILVHCDFEREKPPEKKRSLCLAISKCGKSRRLKPQEFVSTNIPAATELHKIGMEFRSSDSTSLLDISLQRNTLKLPAFVVDDSTKSIFLNLIAFEQLHKNIVTRKEVNEYMYLMGCLVQAADDASLLQSCGIIVTTLPPYEVTLLFRRMSKTISLDPDHLDQEYKEMLRMVRARFNKLSYGWLMELLQTYLKSPWAMMSILAPILFFTLSILQTVYTVLSYVRHK